VRVNVSTGNWMRYSSTHLAQDGVRAQTAEEGQAGHVRRDGTRGREGLQVSLDTE
jgi:hypothetical protein